MDTVTLDAPEATPEDRTDADETPTTALRWRRRVTGEPGIALFAAALGLLAWRFADSEALNLLYADARSHLTIARRLIDGPNSGIVQLGTVWLPLPHALLAPLTMIGSAWRTGSAAAFIGVICLAVEAVCVFRVVLRTSASRLAGWVAAVVLIANPGWLYLHMTALGESVLFASVLLTVAGLSRWATAPKPYSGGEIALFCGLPAAAGVLSRYDGWAIAAASAAFVAFVAQRRWGQWRYTLRCVRAFCVVPAVAALWWFWFNWVHWGDPLEFQRGQYSAQAQQKILLDAGLLPDAGDLGRSFDTYLSATLGGVGVFVAVFAAVAMVAWLAARRFRIDSLAPWLLVTVPGAFYVASLYTGQIALRLGSAEDPSMFNLRYGLQMLPGLAVFCGLGVALVAGASPGMLRRSVSAVAALAVCGFAVHGSWPGDWREVPVISEGLQQLDLAEASWAAAELLAAEADSGLIAIDDSVSPMLPVIDADLDRVAAPFSGPRWAAVLEDPARAEWLFVNHAGDGDAISRALADNEDARDRFDVVFAADDVEVLHRRSQ